MLDNPFGCSIISSADAKFGHVSVHRDNGGNLPERHAMFQTHESRTQEGNRRCVLDLW